MGGTALISRTVPIPHLGQLKAEFRLRFVEENKQDQALTKLESHSYFQGSRNIYWYMDGFEELAVTAGYLDAPVRVIKYRSGLGPQTNVTITTSGTAPDLTDYDGGANTPSDSMKCSAEPGPETLWPGELWG
jgi:hypothetical protein